MNKSEICDNIGLIIEKLTDIGFLMQEIRIRYFEKYDSENKDDMFGIVWEYDRYASLYRISDDCIYEVTSMLKNMDKALNERNTAVVNPHCTIQ